MNKHKILIYSYWLSIVCLIHCISFPIIIMILPFLDIVFGRSEWLEVGIILSVLIFGSYSLIHAYMTHHKNIKPIIIFYFGMALSFYIHFIAHNHDNSGILIEIISGVVIAGAQFYNLKITPKTCTNKEPHSH